MPSIRDGEERAGGSRIPSVLYEGVGTKVAPKDRSFLA